MDTKLADAIGASAVQLSAQGVAVGDAHGLCISTTGGIPPVVTAHSAAILSRASSLHAAAVADSVPRGNPIVRIEGEEVYVDKDSCTDASSTAHAHPRRHHAFSAVTC